MDTVLDTPPSYQSQVRALGEGESVAQAKRLPLSESAADAIDSMRRTIDPFVSRMRREGRDYVVEQGTFLTLDHKAVIAFVVVTRTA